jgi:4-carboxymuconolactone decarboxylase
MMNRRRIFPGVLAVLWLVAAAPAAPAQERMPPIPPDKMTEAQKKIVADMVSSQRGRLPPPMVPMLRSPDLMTRIGGLGDHILFHNSLKPEIFEQTVLLVARQWTQQFEWRHHYPLALKAGVRQETVDAIADGRRPPGLDEDESAAYEFATELLVNKAVSDATYARFLGRFSEENVMDMVGTLGFYTSISMVINVDRTPIEAGTAPLLKPLP